MPVHAVTAPCTETLVESNLELLLQRAPSEEATTLGELFVASANNQKFCLTLEDQVRTDNPLTLANEGEKVYGKTAIPAGRYELTITMSPRFKKRMILVNGVKGFTGIRIHSGNTAEDTEGCILVGAVKDSSKRIHGGSAVLPLLFALVDTALSAGRRVFLTVVNAPPPTGPRAQ